MENDKKKTWIFWAAALAMVFAYSKGRNDAIRELCDKGVGICFICK